MVDYAKSPSVGSTSLRKSTQALHTPSAHTYSHTHSDTNMLESMETLLYQHLHSSISTLLRCTAVPNLHEMSTLVSSARQRATEYIETEMQQGLQALSVQVNTSNSQKRYVCACFFIFF
ncbi:hypothetical protein EON63_01015 [archaeon]|nr:MAG: hypothetical protein EON63_01015 [archaeon]